MRKHLKQFTALVASLIFLLALGSMALADPSFEVQVDDVDVSTSDVIRLERGSTVEVEVVVFDDTDPWEDARLEAKIGGYEYGVIRDTTRVFDLKVGVKTKKTLVLELPDDLEAGDYDLKLELSNGDSGSFSETFDVRVEAARHRLAIQDVILRPGHSVAAGSALFATVRVENMGEKKEEDIRVTVSIPDLGVSARTYLDELTNDEEPNEEEETSMSTEELFLRIPADAKTGEYTVNVVVEFSRGHEVLAAKTRVFVEGAKEASGSAVVVNVDASTKPVVQGDEVAFKVLVANMGDAAKTFTVSVAGERLWATSRVEPATLFVPAESTEEAYVYLTTKASAATGKQLFTVKVLDGTEVVAEKDLLADVSAKFASAGNSLGSTKKALVIGFGVLVVLLVILGLIIAFNRMNEDDDEGEVPTSEGQAYY